MRFEPRAVGERGRRPVDEVTQQDREQRAQQQQVGHSAGLSVKRYQQPYAEDRREGDRRLQRRAGAGVDHMNGVHKPRGRSDRR